MKDWFENMVLMMVIFFLVAAMIPAGFAQGDDELDERRLYIELPDLIIEDANIDDFNGDGVCDGLRVYYKNNGRNGFQIDDDGFMASVVINNLYSSGYAGIYNKEIDLPEELERIKSGQKFHDTIPYNALLGYGFRNGEKNRVIVKIDTRNNVQELSENNNEGIFFIDDDNCQDYDDDEKDGNDEKDHNDDYYDDEKDHDDNEKDYDNGDHNDDQDKQSDVNTCVAARSLFLNENHMFELGENNVKVEVLEINDNVAVFRVNGKLLDLRIGEGEDLENGMIWLKGVGKKEDRLYAVFLLECGKVKEVNSRNLNENEGKKDNKDKPEQRPRREDDLCEDGCKKDDMCLGIGLRLIYDEKPVYCGLDGGLKSQKGQDESCQNNYECESNTCQSGACVDLQEQLKLQTSMLERLLKWFEDIFG